MANRWFCRAPPTILCSRPSESNNKAIMSLKVPRRVNDVLVRVLYKLLTARFWRFRVVIAVRIVARPRYELSARGCANF